MIGLKLDSVIVYTHDLERSVDFYGRILGLGLEYREDAYASFFLGEVRLGIKLADDHSKEPGQQAVILSPDGDLKLLFEVLCAQEVQIAGPYREEIWGAYFSISDPDGNKVELLQRPA